MMGKTLQELTIADNFMFGAVMTMPDNCRRMLELSLDISVGSVEMQVAKKEALAKRTQYYHSQMDMELLVKGKDYSELPKACVHTRGQTPLKFYKVK